MRLRLTHDLKVPLILPLAYHHILQSVIYDCIKEDEVLSDLHDKGYVYEKRSFRMFTFSEIKGPHKIVDDKIVFYDTVSWSVSSCNIRFIESIRNKVENGKINYDGQYYGSVACEISDERIKNNEIIINMMSPIVVYKTDQETGKKTHYSPDSKEFYGLISDNFIRKYKAYYNIFPDDIPVLSIINVNSRDKCVTRFKGIYMTGYKGVYLLSGKTEYLNFLYDVGLGTANSQGFGMFEVCDGD